MAHDVKLQKTLAEKDDKIARISDKNATTITQLAKSKKDMDVTIKEMEARMSNQSAKHKRVMDDYEQQFADKARDCLGFEILVGDLRANIEALKRKHHQEKLQLIRQLALLESAQSKDNKGKWTQEHEDQASRGHQDELRAAAAREDKLNEKIEELKSEKAALRKQLTTEGKAHSQLIEHTIALRDHMARDLGFARPEIISLDQCIDISGASIKEARILIEQKRIELNALRAKLEAQEADDTLWQENQALKAALLQRQNELRESQEQYITCQVELGTLKNKNAANEDLLRIAQHQKAEMYKKLEAK